LNRFLDLDETSYADDDIKDDLDSILRNPVALTIPTWWTFKHLRWVHLSNCASIRSAHASDMLIHACVVGYV
jgi:hypothetical protein